MTNKNKIKFADFVVQQMNCPRDFSIWRLKHAHDFLHLGCPINEKNIKKYAEEFGSSTSVHRLEIERTLRKLLAPKITTPNKELFTSPSTVYQLSDEQEESLKKFSNWLLYTRELSANTVRSYVWTVRRYLSIYKTVSQKGVQMYKQQLMDSNLARATINIRLNGIISYAGFLGVKIEIKLLKKIRVLECNNVPSEPEMKAFLNTANKINHYWYLVARCLSTTGVRVHELLKITYQDIINGQVLLIGKGGKPRRIYFQKGFTAEVQKYMLTKCVLMTDRFCTKTARGVAQQIRLYAKKADLDLTKFHPHAFRHYFAKQYLKKKPSDIIGLQHLLGHTSIETTALYLARSFDEVFKDYQKTVTWK